MSEHKCTSPWLAQLKQERPAFTLQGDAIADIAVIGAGIAGVTTAYQILKTTKRHILLIDAGRIAHGATGRNAGQVVNYFERSFKSIADAFGKDMAVQGQAAVESAWEILENILKECKLETPLHMCVGYDGFCSMEKILDFLEEQSIREQVGLKIEPLLFRANAELFESIPTRLQHLVTQVPHSTILAMLQTEDTGFIAADIAKKRCTNSALLCEELVAWMIRTHGDRFRVVEHLPVQTLVLRSSDAEIKTSSSTITARSVVLCTNGFENFTIENKAGEEIDTAFHHDVQGVIGYMAGYIDEPDQVPAALCYYTEHQDSGPYYYLTRRPFDHTIGVPQTLICIGGPERILPDHAAYDPLQSFPADIQEQLDRGMRDTYHDSPPAASLSFLWQGLMCYTPNKLRRIGFEPKNKVLLYNLGCNGVGILPSIYGGKRVAQLLDGIPLPPSIFDPENGAR